MTPPNASTAPMGPRTVVLLLGLLLGLQPLTTDLYLPALPALRTELGASMAQAQLTLTALLLAFGISQLLWGPLSDRFGRRIVLRVGMLAYTAASVGSALAASIEALIVWRTLQGVAMGAAVVCARAIVRDLYPPAQGATVMSQGLSGLGVLACISAPLGGWLTQQIHWHAALLSLSGFGLLTLGAVWLRFRESLAQPNPQALQPRILLRTWGQIVRTPRFLVFSALSAASYGGLFTFLASSSFVCIQVLGLTPQAYGLCMLLNAFVYLLGTFVCRRWLARWGVQRTLAYAGALSLLGGGGMALLAWAGWHSVAAVMLPMCCFILAHGIHQPCGQSGAVAPFPHSAGAASALNGFLMMLTAFAMGGWLGRHMDGSVFALAYGMGFWACLIALTTWFLVPRYAPTPHPHTHSHTAQPSPR